MDRRPGAHLTRHSLVGGTKITGFQPEADGTWKVHLPAVASGQWYFEQLFVNGRRAVRARTPNRFYHCMLAVREEMLEKGAGERPVRPRQVVTARLEDVLPLLGIEGCEFGHIGRAGVWFRQGCQNCTLRKCYVHDLGAGGVRIGEAGVPKTARAQSGNVQHEEQGRFHGGDSWDAGPARHQPFEPCPLPARR